VFSWVTPTPPKYKASPNRSCDEAEFASEDCIKWVLGAFLRHFVVRGPTRTHHPSTRKSNGDDSASHSMISVGKPRDRAAIRAGRVPKIPRGSTMATMVMRGFGACSTFATTHWARVVAEEPIVQQSVGDLGAGPASCWGPVNKW